MAVGSLASKTGTAWSLNLTPTLNQTGTTTITLTARDDTGLSNVASVFVTVLIPLAFDAQVINCSNTMWSTFGTTLGSGKQMSRTTVRRPRRVEARRGGLEQR